MHLPLVSRTYTAKENTHFCNKNHMFLILDANPQVPDTFNEYNV